MSSSRGNEDISSVKNRFLVYSPRYVNNSNGIALLYKLATTLVELKYDCAIVCYDTLALKYLLEFASSMNFENLPIYYLNKSFFISDVRDSDIVIYSETITGNPLRAKNVVRYLMNRPYFLTGEGIFYGYRDLLVSYSKHVDASLFQLFLLKDELAAQKESENKSGIAIYFGKINVNNLCENYNKIKELLNNNEKITIITRQYPKLKSDLTRIVLSSKYMFSFDPLTNLNYEAALMGTPVLLVDDSYKIGKKDFNISLEGIFNDFETLVKTKFSNKKMVDEHLYQIKYQNSISVEKFIQYCLEHFKKIESDVEYYNERVKYINNRYLKDYFTYKSSDKTVYENIDTIDQLPAYLLKELLPHINE